MATSDTPIIGYMPGGGVASGGEAPGSITGVGITNAAITPLVVGHSYIDVVFDHVQTDNTWIFVECSVLNTADSNPLNIWPGIVTSKLSTGFRLQLNGLPDSNNYFLDWAISGVDIKPTPATTFILSGATSGFVGVPITFTVRLPSSTTVPSPVTVTPTDGGGGGTFSPTNVLLTTGTPSTTFIYTPGSIGSKTINVINNGGLLNPGSIVVSVALLATGYSFTGPSAGTAGTPSTPFTVTLTPAGGVVPAPVTITPSDGGGGGTFTPTTVALTTGAPSATFTYTAGSGGTKTISVTNNGGLTDPGSVSYVSTAPFSPTDIAGLQAWWKADSLALSSGDPVSTWTDSSSAGRNATQTGSARPLFRTNIVNGKPIVEFTNTSSEFMSFTPITGAGPWTLLIVLKSVSGIAIPGVGCSTAANGPYLGVGASGLILAATPAFGSASFTSAGTGWNTGFHYLTLDTSGSFWGDGAVQTATSGAGITTGNMDQIGSAFGAFANGYIAEIVCYNTVLSTTDRGKVELYLKTKYGL